MKIFLSDRHRRHFDQHAPNFGPRKARRRLQPGRLSSGLHSSQVRPSPGVGFARHYRDRPQRIHGRDEALEEAANGRGNERGGR